MTGAMRALGLRVGPWLCETVGLYATPDSWVALGFYDPERTLAEFWFRAEEFRLLGEADIREYGTGVLGAAEAV